MLIFLINPVKNAKAVGREPLRATLTFCTAALDPRGATLTFPPLLWTLSELH